MKEPPLKHGYSIFVTLGAFWKFVGFPLIEKFACLSPTPHSNTADVQLCSAKSQSQLTFPLFWLLVEISGKLFYDF